jgi:hypothetical protein
MESRMDVPQKVKSRITICSHNLTLSIYPQKTKSVVLKRQLSPMFILALFTIKSKRVHIGNILPKTCVKGLISNFTVFRSGPLGRDWAMQIVISSTD